MSNKHITFADLLKAKPTKEETKVNQQADLIKNQLDPIDLDHKKDQPITQSNFNLVKNQPSQPDLVKNQPSQILTQSDINLAKNQPSQHSTRSIFDLVPHYKTPNILDDEICLSLSPSEQVILRRLFRLSYGFNRQYTDNIGISKLAEKCNISISTTKTVLKSLEQRGLIEINSDHSGKPTGGNQYIVLKKYFGDLAKNQPSQILTRSNFNHNKIDHDHDFKDHHHQNAHAHETMTIYQKLTGNSWTKTDDKSYAKIAHLPIEQIATTMRAVISRATQKPASLAYFVKEMLNPTQANPANREALKKKYRQFLAEIREANIGGKLVLADLVGSLKDRLVRDGLAIDDDLINECLK